MIKKFLILLWVSILLMEGCDRVHEFPEPGKEVDPTEIESVVKVDFKIRLSGLNVISKGLPILDPQGETSDKYDRRFIAEFRNAEYNDSIAEYLILTRPASDTSSLLIETKLRSRKYTLYVWMDYVLKGTTDDYFYDTGNGTALDAIQILPKAKYVGGSDFKDVQTFKSDIDLTSYADQWFAEIIIEAQLERPMAKITFLSDDLASYAESIGSKISLEELAGGMKNTFYFNGYLPTSYNLYTGRLNDAQIGYGFAHGTEYPSLFRGNKYTKIGSDYVFVNGESSSVTVTVLIQDKNGRDVNHVDNILVPTEKGKETVVIYHFLTGGYGPATPGIGIDAEFEGEFDIYV